MGQANMAVSHSPSLRLGDVPWGVGHLIIYRAIQLLGKKRISSGQTLCPICVTCQQNKYKFLRQDSSVFHLARRELFR